VREKAHNQAVKGFQLLDEDQTTCILPNQIGFRMRQGIGAGALHECENLKKKGLVQMLE
jgi:hypothetical protein